MKTRFGLLLAATTAMAGCTGSTYDVQVSEQWNKAIQRFGMQPIYPAREDIFPGDVVFADGSVSQGGDSKINWITLAARAEARPMRIGPDGRPAKDVIYVPDVIADVYDQRPVITRDASVVAAASAAASGGKADAKPASGSQGTPPKSPDTFMLWGPHTVMLRNLAVPQLDVGRFSLAEFGATGHAQGLDVALGLRSSSATSVSVTLDDLKSLQVDRVRFMTTADDQAATFLVLRLTPARMLRFLADRDRSLAEAACKMDLDRLKNRKLSFSIVNEVLYAHKITFTYHSDMTFAAKVEAKVKGQSGSSPGVAPTPVVPAAASSATDLRANVKAELDELNGDATSAGTAGSAYARYGVASSGDLKLDKAWDRPLAVGFAGATSYEPGELIRAYKAFYAMILQDPMLPAAQRGIVRQQINEVITLAKAKCSIYGVENARLVAELSAAVSN